MRTEPPQGPLLSLSFPMLGSLSGEASWEAEGSALHTEQCSWPPWVLRETRDAHRLQSWSVTP